VDQDVVVVDLVEPRLRRLLRRHPGGGKRLERELGVLRLDHEVEVVVRLRAAARPRGDAAGEDERDAGVAQRCHGLLQARQHLAEVHLRPVLAHRERLTRAPERITGAWTTSVLATMPTWQARSGS